ncbi:MAG: T9SS type A sorting domain-containing protein, partial [Ignavibacteria bacterium]|nr:T9SS type A sorting domain-containing protein [Ignavibacteria bacterium]
ANESTGWVLSNAGKLYKTTDGWNSRTSIDLNLSNISSIFFYGASTGWMCGGNGQMYYTNNGGANWTLQNTGTTSGLRNIFFIDPNTGWVLGAQYVSPVLIIASIHKTTNGGISAISNISSEVPADFGLSQNYPNPFNPTTNFEFRIAESGFVNLTIYDAMGRAVETLQNGEMKPGVYQAQWNAAEYPSGVYFYKLSASGFTETRKMMLIK